MWCLERSRAGRLASGQKEDLMLAPNPQPDALVYQTKKNKEASGASLERFVFVALLVTAYTIAAAALALPVLVYVWW